MLNFSSFGFPQSPFSCPVMPAWQDPVRRHRGLLPVAILLGGIALLAGTIGPSSQTGPRTPDSRPAALVARNAAVPLTLTADGTALPGLVDGAEAVRARLLGMPGIGAVALRGVETGGLEILYAPARLARLGLSPHALAAAVPGGASPVQPGHIVPHDAVQGGLQTMVDLPLRSARGIFRLGDIATVARTVLPRPMSTLARNGRPAVQIVVTPAPGAAPREIERDIAAIQAGEPPPGTRLTAGW